MNFKKFLDQLCHICKRGKRLFGFPPNAVHLCINCDGQAMDMMYSTGKEDRPISDLPDAGKI